MVTKIVDIQGPPEEVQCEIVERRDGHRGRGQVFAKTETVAQTRPVSK